METGWFGIGSLRRAAQKQSPACAHENVDTRIDTFAYPQGYERAPPRTCSRKRAHVRTNMLQATARTPVCTGSRTNASKYSGMRSGNRTFSTRAQRQPTHVRTSSLLMCATAFVVLSFVRSFSHVFCKLFVTLADRINTTLMVETFISNGYIFAFFLAVSHNTKHNIRFPQTVF